MINADTIYPVIAIVFYLLLLLRATSKQIREFLLEWWQGFITQILPAFRKIVQSLWFVIPVGVISIIVFIWMVIPNFSFNRNTEHINNKASFSFDIVEKEKFLKLNNYEQAELTPAYSDKIKTHYVKKLKKDISKYQYNALQIVTYRQDELMDFNIFVDYSEVNISQLFVETLRQDEELRAQLKKWVPLDITMPILSEGSFYEGRDKKGFKVELRLFHYVVPEPLDKSICHYKTEEGAEEAFYIELSDQNICERGLVNQTQFNPEDHPELFAKDLVVLELEVCLDGAGIIQKTDFEVEKNPNNRYTDTQLLKKVEKLSKLIRFSSSSERWECGSFMLAFN
jgi:hypothetical protein